MIIGVDFDGTCVEHKFPEVGPNVMDAVSVLKELVDKGHQIILWTMRSDNDRHPRGLQDAVDWFEDHNIPLYGVNTNPTQSGWTLSPKAYCQIYIDDAALGCPLIYPENERPFVDWGKVRELLVEQKALV